MSTMEYSTTNLGGCLTVGGRRLWMADVSPDQRADECRNIPNTLDRLFHDCRVGLATRVGWDGVQRLGFCADR